VNSRAGAGVDALGTAHAPAPNARILSLVPSLTELVFDLGLGDKLVGRTHYCIYPKDQISAIPSVGGTKKIKMDRVREIAPTHALVNIDENPRELADDLANAGINVIVTHPMRPDDNLDLFQLMDAIFSTPAAANLYDDFIKARDRIGKVAYWPIRRAQYLIWKDPWMAVSQDTYIAATLGLVNWHIAAGTDRYPEITLDDATLSEVDLVLFSSEPYAFTDAHIAAFQTAHPTHAHKAHLIDGEMTSWYGSRAIPGLNYLNDFARRLSE